MFPLLRTIFGFLIGTIGARLVALLSRLHSSTPEGKRTTRRGFVRNAALGATGVVLAEVGAGIVWLLWPNQTGDFGSDRTVAASEVPPVNGKPYVDPPGKYYLVHNQEGVMALYWKCVHLGCTVPWIESEEQFHCPCHGSLYDYNGVRTGGPEPRPLDLMDVRVELNGDVIVANEDRSTRSGYDPSQATPYPA